jgi:uncharacterized protein YabE (DUF348 family)/3D (Asp-Asp-Asp) domain-containing protein
MGKPAFPARLVNSPRIALALIAAIVAVLLISGFIWAKKGVSIVVDGETVYHTTRAATVGDVLAEVDVALGSFDIASPAFDVRVTDGLVITVRHAVPVTLDCNGAALELQVIGTTVADALVAAGIDPSLGVHVSPPVDAMLVPGMTITATDVFLRIEQEEVSLDFDTIEKPDASLAEGTRVVETVGKTGTAIRVYEIVVTGGIEGLRRVLSEEVLQKPVAKVVAVGTRKPRTLVAQAAAKPIVAPMPAVPPVGGTPVSVVSTAYTPWDPGCGGITVIERKIKAYSIPAGWGIIAVDPSVFPLGTRVYVSEYGFAVAADTGGAMVGNRIDVCFWTQGEAAAKKAAAAWGRRTVTVTVVK